MCNDFDETISLISKGKKNQTHDGDIIERLNNLDTITRNWSSIISCVQQQIISQFDNNFESAKEGFKHVVYSVEKLQLKLLEVKSRLVVYIEKPDIIENKKAFANIQNDDNKCFYRVY